MRIPRLSLYRADWPKLPPVLPKAKLPRRRVGLALSLLSSLALLLLYFQCRTSRQALKIESYREEEHADQVVVYLNGKNFGRLGETQLYLNEGEIDRGRLLHWSDSEIQVLIRRPFRIMTLQLKSEQNSSRYIPIWDEGFLPQVQYNQQVQSIPVLEDYRLISMRPPVLELRGQNFGFCQQGQLLLLSRDSSMHGDIYFQPKVLERYRSIQPSELLFWSKQLVRVLLPQEAVEGPAFLLRFSAAKVEEAGREGLQVSNSLYLPAARNRKLQNTWAGNPASAALRLRLVLHYPAHVFADLSTRPKSGRAREAQVYRSLVQSLARNLSRSRKSSNPEARPESRMLQLAWPRNERGQAWQNALTPSSDQIDDSFSIGLPARTLVLEPLDKKELQNSIEDVIAKLGEAARPELKQLLPKTSAASANGQDSVQAAGWLLQNLGQDIVQRVLYLDFLHANWMQAPPPVSRGQDYNEQELIRFQYVFEGNRALFLRYAVPRWDFGDSLRYRQLSPYWKAMELYKEAVRKLRINAASPTAEAGLSLWPRQFRKDTTAQIEETVTLAAEQPLLLLLRAMTELGIPARIIAGSLSRLPIGSDTTDDTAREVPLQPYYWLEIYLPDFGWFQADLLAEMRAYQLDPGAFNSNSIPSYWGSLNTGESAQEVKLAFFALGSESAGRWQSFDESLHRAGLAKSGFSWRLWHLP